MAATISTSGSSAAIAAPAFELDDMESALDGVSTSSQSSYDIAAAASRADEDPEQIMLALRGLPVFPNMPNDASATPEAAFVVAGGPPCLLREVLLPPYPHPEAPHQLYEAIDEARKLQNRGEYKQSLKLLQQVLLIWKKKHMWKVMRDHPDMDLGEGLQEEIRRAEERAARAIYKEEQRLKREEEEQEFARKMAEQGDADEHTAPSLHAQPRSHQHEDTDSEDEDDEFDEEDEDEDGLSAAARRAKRRQARADAKAAAEAEKNQQETVQPIHEQPEEVLEFPSVSPEEELEFLVFYYNTLGAIYQSAGASASASGSKFPHMGGNLTGGVRWGRMKVVPIPADTNEIKQLLQGTIATAIVATSVTPITQPAYAANFETSILVEEESDEKEEDYISTSASDLSNSSDARALIALWQAKRSHDLYVNKKEGEKNRAAQEARERELAARGGKQEDEDLDDAASHTTGEASGANQGNAIHTTLGMGEFASINIPNLSLAQLQNESKAMGLFGFPHIPLAQANATTSTSSVAAGSGQSALEASKSQIFWSTQPIVLPPVPTKPTESQKLLGFTAAHLAQQNKDAAARTTAANSAKLINPYNLASTADATIYSNLGSTLFHLGNFPLALRCFYVSLQIRAALLRPAQDEYIDLATSLNNIGVVLSVMHFYGNAFKYFQAAVELARARLDPVHPRLNLLENNAKKIQTRRVAIDNAPGLLQELKNIAETKERKEWEAREKRNAKAAKKGAASAKGGKPASARPTSRKTGRMPGGKEPPPPPEFHEDPRFFQEALAGQPPIVPKKVEGAPPQPLGSAAAAIKTMPLRRWEVQMGEMQKLLLEFGPAKKKTAAAGGKKKSKKK